MISWPNWSGKWNQNSAPQFQRKFRAIIQRLDSESLEYTCQYCVAMWCGRYSWSWSNRFPSPSSLDSMSPMKISKHFSNFLTHWSSHVGHFWPMKFKKRSEAWRKDSEKNILIWWEESWNQARPPWPLLLRCDYGRTQWLQLLQPFSDKKLEDKKHMSGYKTRKEESDSYWLWGHFTISLLGISVCVCVYHKDVETFTLVFLNVSLFRKKSFVEYTHTTQNTHTHTHFLSTFSVAWDYIILGLATLYWITNWGLI